MAERRLFCMVKLNCLREVRPTRCAHTIEMPSQRSLALLSFQGKIYLVTPLYLACCLGRTRTRHHGQSIICWAHLFKLCFLIRYVGKFAGRNLCTAVHLWAVMVSGNLFVWVAVWCSEQLSWHAHAECTWASVIKFDISHVLVWMLDFRKMECLKI